MLNRHLLLHFNALGGMGVLAATLFALSGNATAGTAGVCITSAMSFCMSVYWACRHWTGLELDLNSVERIAEYLDLPQEPPSVIESSRPPAGWPSISNEVNLLRVEDLYSQDLLPSSTMCCLASGEGAGWTPGPYRKWKVHFRYESTAIC